MLNRLELGSTNRRFSTSSGASAAELKNRQHLLARAGELADADLLWLLRRRQGTDNIGEEPREEAHDDCDAREGH